MSLTEADLEAIENTVAKQMRTQFEKGCLCGLKPQALSEMGHFWGMLEDVSDGDASKSVETLRSVIKTHHRIETVSSKAMMVAVTLGVTAACYGAFDVLKSIWVFIRGRLAS